MTPDCAFALAAAMYTFQDFIKTSSDKDEPFFLYFNPTTPKEASADTFRALFDYSILETPAGANASCSMLWLWLWLWWWLMPRREFSLSLLALLNS